MGRNITLTDSASTLYDWLLLQSSDNPVINFDVQNFISWYYDFAGEEVSADAVKESFKELRTKKLVSVKSLNVVVEQG